jgi:predicted RND superfamily exporter protein
VNLAQVVDFNTLGRVAIASFIAGVGVTAVFSLAIHGAVRFIDSRRDGRPFEAALYGTLTTLSLLASAAALVLGFVVMTRK